jgi:hypothetical protein
MSWMMLSAVVFLGETQAAKGRAGPALALTRSLSALVSAAVAGLIRDVTIAGPPGEDLATIADHAGCGFVEAAGEADGLSQGLALAKGPDVLVLRAGYVPGPGFIEELRDFGFDRHQCGMFRAAPGAWLERLLPGLAPIAAAVAPLDLWRAQPMRDFHGLTRAMKGRGLRTAMHRVD